ncbi:MAG: hypothetical protein F9K43_24710 [Bauldia sp.]|nr:MAG: hypothetical protein F9K43_24710 [Bauldia sp.]
MAEDQEPGRRDTPGNAAEPVSVPAMDQISAFLSPGRENVTLIYILYLAGLVPAFGIVPIIIGFTMAMLNREHAAPLERSHYEYQFRQALIGLAFAAVSLALIVVLLGFLGFLLTAIWWIIRSVKGLLAINHHRPIADPRTATW